MPVLIGRNETRELSLMSRSELLLEQRCFAVHARLDVYCGQT